ncbi:MAG: hypothetical protein FJ100_16590 [Deltaproteobacteria bacterium]|nr:hypothetical protein [Deltaproteobacteria bacterium]
MLRVSPVAPASGAPGPKWALTSSGSATVTGGPVSLRTHATIARQRPGQPIGAHTKVSKPTPSGDRRISVTLPDGKLAAVGDGNDPSGKKRGLFTVWNAAGATEVNTLGSDVWVREIHGIANTGDGGVVVAGLYESLSTGNDAFIARLKPSGGQEWLQTAPGNSHDYADEVAPIVLDNKAVPQGYVIAGTYSTTIANPEGWLVKYKTDSSKAGEYKWGGTGYDQFRSVATAAGGAIVAGGNTTSYGTGGGTNGAVVRFDHNLNLIWQTILDGAGEQFVADVQFAADGNILALGTNSNPTVGALGGQDLWLVKLDPYGNVLWQRSLGTSAEDSAGALAILPDGMAIAASAAQPGSTSPDGLLVRLDLAGNLLWSYPFGDGVINGAQEALHDVVAWDAHTFGAVGRTTNGTPGNSNDAWVVRAGAWGHQTCGGAGDCFGKPIAACLDDNPCHKPTCEPSTGKGPRND